MTTSEHIYHLQNLRADRNSNLWDERTKGGAPHKPFLLMSIIDGIKTGWITSSQITLSQNLIETFFRYWKSIMGEDRHTTIALPFFHMQSEPFWKLRYNEGFKPYQSSPSLGGLMKRVAYAELNEGMFKMMGDDRSRGMILESLLNTYFADEVQKQMLDIHRINVGAYRYAEQLELLAAEPFQKYHSGDRDDSYTLQKTQQRQYGFGLTIRQHYNHRCAICRTRVKTPNGDSLIEGAHIIPWSESKNDDPRNGLALCKTHHWMFDNYLLTVQPDYHIKLSPWLRDEGEQIEQTLACDREEILLPEKKPFMPSKTALKEHFEQFKAAS